METFDTNKDKLIEVEEIVNSERDVWKSFGRIIDQGSGSERLVFYFVIIYIEAVNYDFLLYISLCCNFY